MKRLPPYMIAAVCGILFLSAGMVIITADSADPAAQPTPTVEIPPTEVVSAPVVAPTIAVQPTDIPAPAPAQPTVVVAAPVVIPTDVVQPVQPTTVVVEQQPSPTAAVEAQTQPQSTVVNSLPVSPVPADSNGTVLTPLIPLPSVPLGTLPPPSNVFPTAENPVVIPTVVQATVQPPMQAQSLPVLMQVTGQIAAPLRADFSGIVVTLTRPDGTALQTTTDRAGNFVFANLVSGAYSVNAGAAGYLSSQTTFMLTQGQNIILPSAVLVGGDTNLDNKIDLTDAALIAANFDSASIVAGADLNHDGVVDIRDLTAIGAYFGLVGPTQWKS